MKNNKLTDREVRDIEKIAGNKDYYYFLPEHRRTAAVSMAAVTAIGNNLEYVPETVINKDICRAALLSKDVDCTILSQIPFPDVQKEAIQRFSGDTPAFVLYSFADIQDAKMAQDAVKAEPYCLQLIPNELMTVELCKLALQNSDTDKKVLGFIPESFRNNPEVRKMEEEKFGGKPVEKENRQTETFTLAKKRKGISNS